MKPLRILMLHRQSTAVAYYRTRVPARIARSLGHDVVYSEDKTYKDFLQPKTRVQPAERVNRWFRENVGKFDILWVDRATSNEEAHAFAGFKHHSKGCRMIVDFDDAFDIVPWWNMARSQYQPGMEAYDAGFNHLRLAEMATVSTEALRKRFSSFTHAIEHMPNRLDAEDWTKWPTSPERVDDPTVRILYGGAAGHLEDLNQTREGLEALLRKPPCPLRLVYLGPMPFWLFDLQQEHPERVVNLPWVPFRDYAAAISWGGFDLALAPLVEDPFNEAKSLIKWSESAVQGIPIIASDIGPYRDIPDGAAIKIDNTPIQWAEALRNMVQDKDLRARVRKAAKEAVHASHTVDSGKEIVQYILERAMDCPRIESLEDTFLPSDQPAEPDVVPAGGAEGDSSMEASTRAPDSPDPPGK
jgi:hypothetical protein